MTSTLSGRRADIQGLRALAVLMVVAFHAGLPVSGGFTGVDVFFVISGFVITNMLFREQTATGTLALGHFYFRRFLRLTPALAVTISVVAAASMLLQSPFGPQAATARTGAGAMLLVANLVIAHGEGDYFADDATFNPLLNTWSLSVEEQFYLVFPALLALGWVLARRLKRPLFPPLVFVALLALCSFVAALVLAYGGTRVEMFPEYFGGSEAFAFYGAFSRVWEFAVGAMLALTGVRAATTRTTHALGVTGALLIAGSAFGLSDSVAFPGFAALLPVTGTALLLLPGSGAPTAVSRLLARRPMVALGNASYSWYLWHWPLIVFGQLLLPNRPLIPAAAAVASLGLALLSYRFVEQPIRSLRPATRGGAAALILFTLTVPLSLCWALQLGDTEGVSGDNSLRSAHAVVDAGCVNITLNPDKCRFGAGSGTVLLAGDSSAYAAADGTIAAASQLGYQTVVTTHTGCPFLGRESSGSHDHPCRSWQKSVLAYAEESLPNVVVIANRSAGYVHPD